MFGQNVVPPWKLISQRTFLIKSQAWASAFNLSALNAFVGSAWTWEIWTASLLGDIPRVGIRYEYNCHVPYRRIRLKQFYANRIIIRFKIANVDRLLFQCCRQSRTSNVRVKATSVFHSSLSPRQVAQPPKWATPALVHWVRRGSELFRHPCLFYAKGQELFNIPIKFQPWMSCNNYARGKRHSNTTRILPLTIGYFQLVLC